MDEVMAFLREYIEKEYEAERASFTERDEAKFTERLVALHPYYEGNLRTGLSRPIEFTDAEWERRRAKAGEVIPRNLFQVKRYRHPRFGDVYRAYVSFTKTYGAGTCNYSMFVREIDGALKVFALYHMCHTCYGTGSDDGDACADCRGRGWTWATGHDFGGDFGSLVEVRKLQPPGPRCLPEYDAE